MADAPIPKAGVMGWPISHSLSPRLHGFWLQSYHIAGHYDALPVAPEDLTTALRSLSVNGLRGVNLTVPHKVAACAVVDHMEATAQRMGAINLVTVEADGKLLGRNTDAYGFAQNLLTSGFVPTGGTAFVLGAGGAARAVIVALLDMGFSKLLLSNRTPENADKLAQEFSTPQCMIEVVPWSEKPDLRDIELLVNTTSLGMTGQPSLIIALDSLPTTATVTDIVYAPLETDLLRQAKAKGYKTIDGLGMLLHQARPAFAAFFGRDPQVTEELRQYVLAGRKS